MKKVNCMLLLALSMTMATLTNSCSEDSGGIEPIRIELSKVTQTDFAACGNEFANSLLANLANQQGERSLNAVVSPISVQYLISMMANTATDEARAEVLAPRPRPRAQPRESSHRQTRPRGYALTIPSSTPSVRTPLEPSSL